MNRIKNLQTSLPRGAPLDSADLKQLGISPALAHEYVRTGWLVRLGRGVFMFPGDNLDRNATLRFLGRKVPGLHVAAKTALEWHGFRQNLAHRETLSLRGARSLTLPDWFQQRFPARYSAPKLFSEELPPDFGLAVMPESQDGPLVSVPERALLEMLGEVGVNQEVGEAREIMETLRQPRIRELTTLMRACRMTKALRLCVIWSGELALPWAGTVREAVAGQLGTSRWVKGMKDGRTLILNPL